MLSGSKPQIETDLLEGTLCFSAYVTKQASLTSNLAAYVRQCHLHRGHWSFCALSSDHIVTVMGTRALVLITDCISTKYIRQLQSTSCNLVSNILWPFSVFSLLFWSRLERHLSCLCVGVYVCLCVLLIAVWQRPPFRREKESAFQSKRSEWAEQRTSFLHLSVSLFLPLLHGRNNVCFEYLPNSSGRTEKRTISVTPKNMSDCYC